MNGTWGYKVYDHKWKTPETLIRNLCDIASKGGNYLLNVGPDALGNFPKESVESLKAIGAWTKVNGEAIYATKSSPLKPMDWGRCTRKEVGGNTVLYFSVFNWPADGKLTIPGVKNKVVAAKMLAGGTALKTTTNADGLVINVPSKAPDAIASVIKVTLKGKVENQLTDANGKMKTGSID
jgi:alpha-L-fucosidase